MYITLIGGKLLNHVACTTMIKSLKKRLGPTKEDLELADKIRNLYETHDVTITTNSWGGWRVSVKKKKETK